MDKRRKRVFELYAGDLEPMSLNEIATDLEQPRADGRTPVFHAFPIRDWLHLVKNPRQRVRKHTVTLRPAARSSTYPRSMRWFLRPVGARPELLDGK
jgi:hypothetical protein